MYQYHEDTSLNPALEVEVNAIDFEAHSAYLEKRKLEDLAKQQARKSQQKCPNVKIC